MEEQLITFETAKLAKEKGFDLEVLEFYNEKGILEDYDNYMNYGCEGGVSLQEWYINHNIFKGRYSAPTQSLLQRWLREVYKINITITLIKENSYSPSVYSKSASYHAIGVSMFGKQMSYEEALEVALQKALELI